MTNKMLGNISDVNFALNGYKDVCNGLSVALKGKHWSVADFVGLGGTGIKVDKYTKYSEDDRQNRFAEVMYDIDDLLHKTKKNNINELVGVPVEAEFDGKILVSWRVLQEVI